MTRQYDDIVIGVGGMGSATTYQLAKRGRDVLGLERYDVPTRWAPHTASRGSSGSPTTRIRRTCR